MRQLPHPIIIGTKFMRDNKLLLDMETGTIHFKPSISDKQAYLVTSSQLHLKPYHEVLVDTQIHQGNKITI